MNDRGISHFVQTVDNFPRGGGRHLLFDQIISLENLSISWDEFRRGKENKSDVQQFALNLEDHLFDLHQRLAENRYKHESYSSFYIQDPKLRHIHKASVADRALQHAIDQIIEPLSETTFIFDSY